MVSFLQGICAPYVLHNLLCRPIEFALSTGEAPTELVPLPHTSHPGRDGTGHLRVGGRLEIYQSLKKPIYLAARIYRIMENGAPPFSEPVLLHGAFVGHVECSRTGIDVFALLVAAPPSSPLSAASLPSLPSLSSLGSSLSSLPTSLPSLPYLPSLPSLPSLPGFLGSGTLQRTSMKLYIDHNKKFALCSLFQVVNGRKLIHLLLCAGRSWATGLSR